MLSLPRSHVFVVLVLALALAGGPGARALKCVHQLSSCACETEYGGQVVNFAKLNSGSVVIPRFSARMDAEPYWTFEYNPCGPFYCGDRSLAASCVVGWSDPLGVMIGGATTANFVDTPDYYTTMIRYSALGVNGTVFQTDVTFECRPEVEGIFYVKHVFLQKYFTLAVETKYACIEGTPPPAPPLSWTTTSTRSASSSSAASSPHPHVPDDDRGPSLGTIVVLVVAVLLLLYIVGGVLINCARRRSNPDASLFPHATFWVEFWANVVAGPMYLWWLVRGRPGATAAGYGQGFEPAPESGRAAPVASSSTAYSGARFGTSIGAGGADAGATYGSGSNSSYQPV